MPIHILWINQRTHASQILDLNSGTWKASEMSLESILINFTHRVKYVSSTMYGDHYLVSTRPRTALNVNKTKSFTAVHLCPSGKYTLDECLVMHFQSISTDYEAIFAVIGLKTGAKVNV